MKYGITTFVIGLLLTGHALAADGEDEKMKQDFSYAVGYQIGMGLKNDGIDINKESMMNGIEDVMKGKAPRLSQERIQQVMQAQQQKQLKQHMAMASKNKKASDDFMKKTKDKKDVTALPSGVLYTVLKDGSGQKPKSTDSVVAHYRGTLINGTEFDSSYKRDKPANFSVSGVIKGWQEVLQLMKVGAKWKVWIPPHLAYGEQGAGKAIGPNEALIFEIELLDIKK